MSMGFRATDEIRPVIARGVVMGRSFRKNLDVYPAHDGVKALRKHSTSERRRVTLWHVELGNIDIGHSRPHTPGHLPTDFP
jgi:hypothetical protein